MPLQKALKPRLSPLESPGSSLTPLARHDRRGGARVHSRRTIPRPKVPPSPAAGFSWNGFWCSSG